MFLHALLWTFCRLIYHWHSIKVILIKSEKILHCQLWEANEAITANLDRDEHIVEHALTTVPIETVNLNSFFLWNFKIYYEGGRQGGGTGQRERLGRRRQRQGTDEPRWLCRRRIASFKTYHETGKYLMTTMSWSTCGVTLKNYWWQKGNMTRWIVSWCWNHTRKQWGMVGDFMFYAM